MCREHVSNRIHTLVSKIDVKHCTIEPITGVFDQFKRLVYRTGRSNHFNAEGLKRSR